jgi:hypothetical protein
MVRCGSEALQQAWEERYGPTPLLTKHTKAQRNTKQKTKGFFVFFLSFVFLVARKPSVLSQPARLIAR